MIEPKTLDAEEMDQVVEIVKEYFISRGFKVIRADHFIPIENTMSISVETNALPEKLISGIDLDDYLQLHHHRLYVIELLRFHLAKDKISMDLWIRLRA
jgi:hypothetical protein